jgi:hypothetical protein
MRECCSEIHGYATAEREADDAEGLGAPRERRGGRCEQELESQETAVVENQWRLGVAASPEVYMGLVSFGCQLLSWWREFPRRIEDHGI